MYSQFGETYCSYHEMDLKITFANILMERHVHIFASDTVRHVRTF
jgi:hypothetical protein